MTAPLVVPSPLAPADHIASRGIKKVVHFHTDHFEPVAGAGLDKVKEYLERAAEFRHASRASLFYLQAIDNDDKILTTLSDARADVHVHVHHEKWTSGRHSGLDIDPERDARRLDYYLAELLPYMRRHYAHASLKQWGFIHGCWALNGSDPDICHISDEIRILAKHGCVADFSFPAGRGYCDPAIKHPLDIRPTNAVRSYDDTEADPREVTSLVRPGHFLVRSSKSEFFEMSLEHVAEAPTPGPVVDAWLRKCPIIDGTLYIRTFCHTMNPVFWIPGAITPTPILTPQVTAVFGALERVCEEAEIMVFYGNASEVMYQLGVWKTSMTAQTYTKVGASLFHAVDAWFADNEVELARDEYYRRRWVDRRILTAGEIRLCEWLLARKETHPGMVTGCEIGCGFGQLSACLSALSFKMTAVDGAPNRASAARFVRRSLGAKYEVVEGYFPDAVAGREFDFLVATNVANSWWEQQPESNEVKWQWFMGIGKELILDATYWFRKRNEEEQKFLVQEIRSYGYTVESVFDTYWLVTRGTNGAA